MRTNGTLVHPEMMELMNICAVSPDGAKDVCELIQKMVMETSKDKEQVQTKKKEEDKELDRDLKDTFPASDPFTHY